MAIIALIREFVVVSARKISISGARVPPWLNPGVTGIHVS